MCLDPQNTDPGVLKMFIMQQGVRTAVVSANLGLLTQE